MNATSISSYRKHRYSGPIKNRKRVRAQLKHHHGETVSRAEVWREKRQRQTGTNESEVYSSSGPRILKTYSRRKKASFDIDAQQCHQLTSSRQPSTDTCSEKDPLDVKCPEADPDSTLESPELTVKKEVDSLSALTGNRIVDIQHVLRWAFTLATHRQTCANSTIEFVSELQSGFHSVFIFKCSMCDEEFSESNESSDKLNTAFVWANLTGGGNYTQASHLTSTMDIPTMDAHKYSKIEQLLSDTCKDQLAEEIKKIGEQEAAIENGQISGNGIP